MSLLQLSTGPSLLLSAYEASREDAGGMTGDDLAAKYRELFPHAVSAAPTGPTVFERFSLVDPSIRTVVRSSTVTD